MLKKCRDLRFAALLRPVTTDFERVDAQQIGAQQTTADFFNELPYSLAIGIHNRDSGNHRGNLHLRT